MSGDATRTKAAIQARRNNTEQMLQRVRDALRQMRRDHIPAQTAMVARRAEVSRTFLYQNEQPHDLRPGDPRGGAAPAPPGASPGCRCTGSAAGWSPGNRAGSANAWRRQE